MGVVTATTAPADLSTIYVLIVILMLCVVFGGCSIAYIMFNMGGGNGRGEEGGKLKQRVEMTQMNPLAEPRNSPFQSQQPQQTREEKRRQELAQAQRKNSIRRISKLRQQQ